MKILSVLSILLAASIAFAQSPEIDISDNYCHFARSTEDPNDEVFVSNCGGYIDVIDGVANGYALVKWKRNPFNLQSQTITSEDAPDIRCEMTESNGNTYLSNDWVSRIRASRHGFIIFELTCRDGEVPQQ